jgi:hypothetical protein
MILFKMKFLGLFYLVTIVIIALSQTVTAASWSFKNWDQYAKEPASSDPSWKSKWHIPDQNGWSWPWNGDGFNYAIVNDPSRSSKEQGILQVTYPAYSMNPTVSPQGGIGFYAQPIALPDSPSLLDLSYQVFFPKNFDFVKGNLIPLSSVCAPLNLSLSLSLSLPRRQVARCLWRPRKVLCWD